MTRTYQRSVSTAGGDENYSVDFYTLQLARSTLYARKEIPATREQTVRRVFRPLRLHRFFAPLLVRRPRANLINLHDATGIRPLTASCSRRACRERLTAARNTDRVYTDILGYYFVIRVVQSP